MAVVVVGLLCLVGSVLTAPAKTFDQRQQGELNIHAQLDNIVVVVIPSAKLNLLKLASSTKYAGEKGGFFQALQKLHKDIERYENSNNDEDDATSDSQNDINTELTMPVITSQQVVISHEDKKEEINKEKEEEVVAKVEEMKPTAENHSDPKENKNDVKEPSPISGPEQDSVVSVTIPIEIKDEVKKEEEKLPVLDKGSDKDEVLTLTQEVSSDEDKGIEDTSSEKHDSSEKESKFPSKENDSSEKDTPSKITSSESSESDSKESTESVNPGLDAFIKPVAVKEKEVASSTFMKRKDTEEPAAPSKTIEPVRLQEGTRKEKLIRYKPDTKWAPGLVDILGPSRRSKELQERQQFGDLCSPGVWDTELKTCIMPGETRSRSDLARFLQAMRFGIVLPSQ